MNGRHCGNYQVGPWRKEVLMKKAKIKAIVVILDSLAKMGALDPDEHIALRKAVGELMHALSVKDYALIEKAIDKIAKLLLRKV